MLNVNNSISNNDKKKFHDLILFLFVYQLFIYNDSFGHDMINCAIVNCNPPPHLGGKVGTCGAFSLFGLLVTPD
jgi:hypothetical protein